MPAVGEKALPGVVTKPGIHLAINRNAIIVIQRNELGQAPDTG